MKYRTASIYIDTDNVHLIKDPGMIPYSLAKYYDFESSIVLSGCKQYPYLDTFYKGINTEFIQEKLSTAQIIRKLKRSLWIIRNARRIDLLNLFFFNKWTVLNIFLYRIVNPEGLVYVHCDTGGRLLKNYKYPEKFPAKQITDLLLNKKNLDNTIWGFQQLLGTELMKKIKPFENSIYIPDGYFFENNSNIDFDEKENIILSVGLLCREPKRTDLLLNAFAIVNGSFPEWKLRIVGSIEKGFEDYIESFLNAHAELKNRIEITGNISDRNILQGEYKKARVFCLTSDRESFGIVQTEAMRNGCTLICSDIPSSIVKESGLGKEFPRGDYESLASAICEAISDKDYMRSMCYKGQEYSENHYSWKQTLRPLVTWMENKKIHEGT